VESKGEKSGEFWGTMGGQNIKNQATLDPAGAEMAWGGRKIASTVAGGVKGMVLDGKFGGKKKRGKN